MASSLQTAGIYYYWQLVDTFSENIFLNISINFNRNEKDFVVNCQLLLSIISKLCIHATLLILWLQELKKNMDAWQKSKDSQASCNNILAHVFCFSK